MRSIGMHNKRKTEADLSEHERLQAMKDAIDAAENAVDVLVASAQRRINLLEAENKRLNAIINKGLRK